MLPARSVVAIALVAISAACGSDASGPVVGPPARIEVVQALPASAVVASAAGAFAVRVTDATGTAVSGASVNFTATSGASVSPATVTTDSAGVATTRVTVATTAGPAQVTATVAGTPLVTSVQLLGVAGPLVRLLLSPKSVVLAGANDTARIAMAGFDAYGNAVVVSGSRFATFGPAIVSVDSSGLVRALVSQGNTLVIGYAGGHSDTVAVSVGSTLLACGPNTARGLALGEAVTLRPSDTPCLGGGIAGAEFGLVAWNGDTASAAPLSVRGEGLATVLAASMQRSSAMVPATRPDVDFHAELLRRSRTLATLIPAARSWRSARASASAGAFTPRPSYAVIPATVQVGDVLRFNVNGYSPCDSPTYRDARVMAVSRNAVVLADTLNPSGGFTSADYAGIAARFDTLVYPLDTAAFGAPTDIDANGRVGILFTSYVNSLTSRGSGSYVGGYFFGRDLFPRTATSTLQACAGSNEGEMFYMLAPDPNGMVSDPRATDFVMSITPSTIAHEFQHLINTSRRIFVSTTAQGFEDVWLDEGLSHVAEELLFYRESGLAPRHDLGDAELHASARAGTAFANDQRQNALRYDAYLESPRSNGPVANNDELATRGAAWSFLRFAADQQYAQDADVWYRLVNSGTSGLATLRAGFPSDPSALLRDWAVSNLVDDAGVTTEARFQQPSWNHRDVFTHMAGIARYPLSVVALTDSVTANAIVAGTTAAYYRFAVAAGGQARVTFGAPGTVQFVVVRMR